MSKLISQDRNHDGIDRRGFLECMAWAGTGVLWTVGPGVLSSHAFGQTKKTEAKGELHFVQISDSHMGFNKPANSDVTGSLQATIEKINGLPREPDFIIHTGDLSHTSKATEFDTLDQVLISAKPKQVFFVPGEHDTSVDDRKAYMERYGKNAKGADGTALTTRTSTSSGSRTSRHRTGVRIGRRVFRVPCAMVASYIATPTSAIPRVNSGAATF